MPEKNSTDQEIRYQKRVVSLRESIKNHDLDGYILPRTDEYQGEFLAPYAERLAWISGFTGSAGAAVFLQDKAVVMSDGRYTLQLAQQVPASVYTCADSTQTSIGRWLAENAQAGARIGYDVWLFTPKQIDKIEKEIRDLDMTLVPLERNLIDPLWTDQPERPVAPVTRFPDAVAGQTSREKRDIIGKAVKETGTAACLLSAGDSICWLLNVRGGDIAYSPLVLSYALIYADGRVDWFVDRAKVDNDIVATLGPDVKIYDDQEMERVIGAVNGALWLDRSSAPVWFEQVCKGSGISVIEGYDPCSVPKSLKTPQEQEAMRAAHVTDGVAIVRFLKWLDETGAQGETELTVEAKLEAFRRDSASYIEPSFPTIAGFAEHGAVVHYRASSETAKPISGEGLLLVDSGGQYQWGTTDITRTIPIGAPTPEMRAHYTRVLKGHIAVSRACFAAGTTGKEIDGLARTPLQEAGLDYAHGTGHGVGVYLCVHEAASNLSPRCDKAVLPGMILSNEPGYYREGAYGIRIENLVLCHAEDGNGKALYFETLTLAPYDRHLIDFEMLDDAERAWLSAYHSKVYHALSSHLTEEERCWLAQFSSVEES